MIKREHFGEQILKRKTKSGDWSEDQFEEMAKVCRRMDKMIDREYAELNCRLRYYGNLIHEQYKALRSQLPEDQRAIIGTLTEENKRLGDKLIAHLRARTQYDIDCERKGCNDI